MYKAERKKVYFDFPLYVYNALIVEMLSPRLLHSSPVPAPYVPRTCFGLSMFLLGIVQWFIGKGKVYMTCDCL